MSPVEQEKGGRKPQEADPLLHAVEEAAKSDNESKGLGDGTVESLSHASGGSFFETVKENFENAMDTVRENVEELQEDFLQEVHDVTEVVDQKLHEADNSNMPVLDMALTQTLSILPSDLAQVAAVIHEIDQDDNASVFDDAAPLLEANEDPTTAPPMLPVAAPEGEQSVAPSKIPIFAFLVLGFAVIGLSSVGPILDFQSDCSPLMKVVWRQNGTILILLPFLYADIKKNGIPCLSCAEWLNFVFTVTGYACANICFVQALEYTTVGNVVIFANSQAILLLLGKILVGTPITFLEGFGALTAFAGAILCSEDGASASDGTDASGGFLGDFIALGAGLSGVIYLVCAQTSRKNFSLFMLMFLTMIGANFLIILFQLFILHEPLSSGIDKFHGIWGFLDVSRFDRLPLEFINVVVCNLFGAFGYVMAMQYFDSLVIAVAGLLQPVVATFTAFIIGVGLLPGLMGWMGNVLVAGGTFAVVYKPPAEDLKKEAPATKEKSVTIDV